MSELFCLADDADIERMLDIFALSGAPTSTQSIPRQRRPTCSLRILRWRPSRRALQRPEYAAQVARYAAEALDSGKLVAVRDGIAELLGLPDASLTASSPWTSRSAYAHANCSLNGGPSQPYLDPTCDLLTFDGTEAACDAATARRRVWLPQRLFL